MSTLVVSADVTASPNGSGRIASYESTYATARTSATNGAAISAAAFGYVGQEFFASNYACKEVFLKFDTSALPDNAVISAVLLELNIYGRDGTQNFILEARIRNWGSTLELADFVSGDDLAGLTLVANYDMAGFVAGWCSFTSEAAFTSNVSLTGITYVVISSSRHRLSNAPTGFTEMANHYIDEPSKIPKLTITYTTPTAYTQAVTGTLSFVGAIVKKDFKSFSGVLSFVGSLAKRTPKLLSGAVSFAGATIAVATVKQILAGTLSFVGNVSRSLVQSKALSGTLSFVGGLSRGTRKTITGSLALSGAVTRAATRSMAGALSSTGTLNKRFPHLLVGAVSFTGLMSSQFVKTWVEPILKILGRFIGISHHQRAKLIVRGPEVAYKRGTDVLFEVTFTDKTGQVFDPDPGTIKLYCKLLSTGVYLTGYTRAGGGVAMTKTSVGVYEADVQFLITDTVGAYEVEAEGKIGAKNFLDSVKISVRA